MATEFQISTQLPPEAKAGRKLIRLLKTIVKRGQSVKKRVSNQEVLRNPDNARKLGESSSAGNTIYSAQSAATVDGSLNVEESKLKGEASSGSKLSALVKRSGFSSSGAAHVAIANFIQGHAAQQKRRQHNMYMQSVAQAYNYQHTLGYGGVPIFNVGMQRMVPSTNTGSAKPSAYGSGTFGGTDGSTHQPGAKNQEHLFQYHRYPESYAPTPMIQENWQLPLMMNNPSDEGSSNVMMMAGTNAVNVGNQNYHMTNQPQPSIHGDVGAVAYTADVNYTNTNRDIPTLLSSWKNNEPPYNIVAREHAEGTGIVGGKKL